MDEFPEEVIRRELNGSERLLWAGRPRQGFALRPADAFLIPFSVLWGGFAIFWEARVLTSDDPWFFGIFGIPFVLLGLYLMVGRFWVDMRQRAATVYGVTSERVVIVSSFYSRNVKSLNIDTLAEVSLTERSQGGTIMFGAVPQMYAWQGAGWPSFGQQTVPTFELAEGGQEVYDLVLDARRKSKQDVPAQ